MKESFFFFYFKNAVQTKKNCKIQKEDLPFIIHNVHTRNSHRLHQLLIRPFILRIS